MGHKHERPVEPFSDLHVEHGHVRATLLHDPTVEGLDMAIYMDGSASMSGDYAYKKKYNDDVKVYAPYVYDAVNVMVAAMVKAGSAEPA